MRKSKDTDAPAPETGRAKHLTPQSVPPKPSDVPEIVVVPMAQLKDAIADAVSTGVERAVRQSPLPALLDRKTLAHEMMVSESQVDNLRKAGMPWLRVGDSPRFVLATCIEWHIEQDQSNDNG